MVKKSPTKKFTIRISEIYLYVARTVQNTTKFWLFEEKNFQERNPIIT